MKTLTSDEVAPATLAAANQAAAADPVEQTEPPSSWPLVLCLVGLDYFSTLAYLPSIAVEAAGAFAPLAALFVVAVTFGLALPIYYYVVGRSPRGRGATGLLEQNWPGWRGKLLVLTLLGFAAADFVITRSLSVADAATHLLCNPHSQRLLEGLHKQAELLSNDSVPWLAPAARLLFAPQMLVTLGLAVLSFAFWSYLKAGVTRGVLFAALCVVSVYLLLCGIIVFGGLIYVAGHWRLVEVWLAELGVAGKQANWRSALPTGLSIALWSFPQLALGLSGFELTMTTASRVRGGPGPLTHWLPGRVRNTRRLMTAAALIMAAYLFGAVCVTTLLLPRSSLAEGGAAQHRALAYLAHGQPLSDGQSAAVLSPWFGEIFGDLYDLSAIAILCLAGASVTLGLRGLLPHYLHRLGMEFSWAGRVGVIMLALNIVVLLLTVVFKASLSAQQWAYATSVLMLVAGAALAASRDLSVRYRDDPWRRWLRLPPAVACTFLTFMAGLTIVINHSGLTIALAFVATILTTSFFSRWMRSTEMRFEGFAFADSTSRVRWGELQRLPLKTLAPHRPGIVSLADKHAALVKDWRLGTDRPLIFVEVRMGDPSDFYHAPLLRIEREGSLEVIRVSKCVSVAHVLAAICLELCHHGEPPEILFGWSHESPMAANLNFLLLGEGNIPWLVKSLVRRACKPTGREPRVIIG